MSKEIKSLVAKGRVGGGGNHSWVSRDWKHVKCQAIGCKYNVAESCATPSRCKIQADGRCSGFEAKPPPKVGGD